MPPLKPSRRELLKLAGGTAAVVGLEGCFRIPDEAVVPYASRPPGITPGVPQGYATSWALDGDALGLVVNTYEGRPTRVDGNPDHPWSLGATGVFEQAELERLFDASRIRTCRIDGDSADWPDLQGRLLQLSTTWEERGGEGVWFLHEPDTSPLLASLRARITERFPAARFVAWSPVGDDSAAEGARLAFGEPVTPVPDFRATRIGVFLDADPLGLWPGQVRLSRDLAERRAQEDDPSRLYCAEATFTLTGMFCDHRLPLRSARVAALSLGVVEALVRRGVDALAPLRAQGIQLEERERNWVEAVAKDLADHRGEGAVLVGPRQPPLVHALAQAVNEALGNIGRTIRLYPRGAAAAGSLVDLVEAMKRGEVETLVISAWNPLHAAPSDLGFGEALRRVHRTLYHGYLPDETARAASWVAPLAHPFESWGDVRSPDGTVGLVQPLVNPLFGAVSAVELWSTFAGTGEQSAFEQLRNFWAPPDDPQREETFAQWLSKSVVPGTRVEPLTPTIQRDAIAAQVRQWSPPPQEGIELGLVPDYKVYDGRFASNPLLQELPDPVTKVTWDNAALVSPNTARKLGLETGREVMLRLRDRSVRAPVFVLPGHADEVITVSLGYGFDGPEKYVEGPVGFDAYLLRTQDAPWFADGLVVERLDSKHPLAITQEHGWTHGRELAIDKTLEEWTGNRNQLENKRGEVEALYQWNYDGAPHAWGMTLDLARCTGCSACVLACQTENNIPVVGRDQVRRGREMHWLRIDRYFLGDGAVPRAITQPLMCVHCEQAPCEYVCPVNATVHHAEGINQQVYNRCIGTRYCSNNCPYKVRRFNFLEYNGDVTPIERVHKNPDVTVRARGVMEKCTYCIQRIERARITSRNENRELHTDEVTTACQQACPTRAIVFGDLADPRASVRKSWEDLRAYALLHHLGTRPRTRHLARIRNPEPTLEEQEKQR